MESETATRNHRRRTRRRHTASEHRVGRGMAHSVRAIYSARLVSLATPFNLWRARLSARLALFIHGITSAKRMRDQSSAGA